MASAVWSDFKKRHWVRSKEVNPPGTALSRQRFGRLIGTGLRRKVMVLTRPYVRSWRDCRACSNGWFASAGPANAARFLGSQQPLRSPVHPQLVEPSEMLKTSVIFIAEAFIAQGVYFRRGFGRFISARWLSSSAGDIVAHGVVANVMQMSYLLSRRAA